MISFGRNIQIIHIYVRIYVRIYIRIYTSVNRFIFVKLNLCFVCNSHAIEDITLRLKSKYIGKHRAISNTHLSEF